MPNRSVRRRQDRDAARKRPRLFVGDNVVARALSEVFPAADVVDRPLPDKVPGVHRWLVFVSYLVEHPGLLDRSDVQMTLGPKNVTQMSIGCWDCEQPWSKETADRPCPNHPLAEGDTEQ